MALVEKRPDFQPSRNPVSAIANVCKVTGTPDGKGNEICDNTAIIAVHIPVIIRVRVDENEVLFAEFVFIE